MKKKIKKSRKAERKIPPKALLSKQWQSTSTLSERAAEAPDPANGSPSGTVPPPLPKDLTLTVTPDILCCGGEKTITAKAEITGPGAADTDVTVTCPDGSFPGKGTITHVYKVTPADCGTDIPFSADGADKHKEQKVADIKITVNMNDPHRVGITAGGHNRTQQLSATVAPAEFGVEALVTAGPLLTLTNIKPLSALVTFDLVGRRPGSTLKGDTFVEVAVRSCKVRKKVSIIKPRGTGTPHKGLTVPYTTAARLVALDETTVPPAEGVPNTKKALNISISAPHIITVWDQFGEPIGDLYAGATVTEFRGSKLNVTLKADSTYSDMAGGTALPGNIYFGPVVPNGDPRIAVWLARPIPPAVSIPPQPCDAPFIEIDGFTLSPAIAGRTWKVVPPDFIIDWK